MGRAYGQFPQDLEKQMGRSSPSISYDIDPGPCPEPGQEEAETGIRPVIDEFLKSAYNEKYRSLPPSHATQGLGILGCCSKPSNRREEV